MPARRDGRDWLLYSDTEERAAVIDRKTAVVFCTYALRTGNTLPKLQGLVERKGGIVHGGLAIRRDKIEDKGDKTVDKALQ